jgi:hypothetical protein
MSARCVSPAIAFAVSNQEEVWLVISQGGLGPQRRIVFVRRFAKDLLRRAFLVLNNRNVYKKRSVRERLVSRTDQIKVSSLLLCFRALARGEHFKCGLKGEILSGVPPRDVKGLIRTEILHSRRKQKPRFRARGHIKRWHICSAA